jgi:hypothetical protein
VSRPIVSRGASAAGLRRGDRVTVRNLSKILATLDSDAKCDGVPFMPEMARYCGRTFRVHRRADKTCVEQIGLRGMNDTVFLEGLRCDGSAHAGCQRGCLFFWKEAWLRPADDTNDGEQITKSVCRGNNSGHAIESLHFNNADELPTTRGDRFYCQSTELAKATHDLPPGRLRSYLHDLRIGEITLPRFAYILWLALANRIWRLLYGHAYSRIAGEQKTTHRGELNLEAGQWVEVKSYDEIRTTLDAQGRNRGLTFEAEMARYCGQRFRVATLVHDIIAEATGAMVHLNNTVILDGLVCEGVCAKNCPRANYFYWREIWLRRV